MIYIFIMSYTLPLRTDYSHKVLLKSIQQLQRYSNIALYAYCIRNQGLISVLKCLTGPWHISPWY
jgi:hypothetical protein